MYVLILALLAIKRVLDFSAVLATIFILVAVFALVAEASKNVKDDSGKMVKRTLEKFFIHHRLSKEEISEALGRLEDVLLLRKFEERGLEARDIFRCRNIRVREFLLRGYGFRNFIKKLKGRVIRREGENEPLRIASAVGEPIMMIKVKDQRSWGIKKIHMWSRST